MLSESVGKALCLAVGSEAEETARFVLIFDKFFDILNVRSFKEGARKRKKFMHPYRSINDERLEVSHQISIHLL